MLASVIFLCYDSFMKKPSSQRRLNIFIDETGEFGFSGKSAKFYGISLVIHEQNDSIEKEISNLEKKFEQLGFFGTFHMGGLLYSHGEFKNIDATTRKRIFFAMYDFARKIKVKYYSAIFEKTFSNNPDTLKKKIYMTLTDLVNNHFDYFSSFDDVIVYYDSGQSKLASVIDDVFSILNGYRRKVHFDHYEKKLFQVADLICTLKLLAIKHEKKELSNSELLIFHNPKDLKKQFLKPIQKKEFQG